MILLTWLRTLGNQRRSSARRHCNSARVSHWIDLLEHRCLLTSPATLSVVDLGAIPIEQFSGDLVTKPVAFNPNTGETTVLFNSSEPSPLGFVTAPDPRWLIVSENSELRPLDFGYPIFISQLGRNDSGSVIGSGDGMVNGRARAIVFDLTTGEITLIPFSQNDPFQTTSVGLSLNFPILTVANSTLDFSINLTTLEQSGLENLDGHFGSTFVVNGPAALIGGKDNVLDNALVAWDANTGAQTTQFVVPTLSTSTSEFIFAGGGFREFTGIFGASDEHPAVAAIGFEDGTLDLLTPENSTITRYVGFFAIDGGELLSGQFFATSNANALSTELGESILTVHEAVVGNPTLSLFDPPPTTELTVTIWDGSSFESQSLESILAAQGVVADLSGYAVVGIDSVLDADGNIRVSILIEKDDPATGDVINTLLVALSYPGDTIVDPPGGGDGGETGGGGNGGNTGGETGGDSGSGGNGGETGGNTGGGTTDPGNGGTDPGNGGSDPPDTGSDPDTDSEPEIDEAFIPVLPLSLDLSPGLSSLLQNTAFLHQVVVQTPPPAFPVQQAERAYEPSSILVGSVASSIEKFREAVQTARRFLGSMIQYSSAQLRTELGKLADMGRIDRSLIEALMLEFSDQLHDGQIRNDPHVVPAGNTQPAPMKVAGTANANAVPGDEEEDSETAGMEEALKVLQGAGSK